MKAMAQERREAAPESAARRGCGEHDDDVPASRLGPAGERGETARKRSRHELTFSADVPDVCAEADDETR